MSKILFFITSLYFFITGFIYGQKNEYVPVKYTTRTIQNEDLLEIMFYKQDFLLSIVLFKESEKTVLNVADKQLQVSLDYTYNNDETSIITKNIYLFRKSNNYVILLPSYTEEFITFQMICFTRNGVFKDLGFYTYDYKVFSKIKNVSFDKIKYTIKEDNTIPQIYLLYNNQSIAFNSFRKSEVKKILSKEEKEQIKYLRQMK